MAWRLARAFNTTPELWLNLQRNYDLWHTAQRSEAWRQVPVLVATSWSACLQNMSWETRPPSSSMRLPTQGLSHMPDKRSNL